MVVRGGSVNPAASPDEEFELYSIPAHDRGGPEIAKGSAIGSSKQIVEPSDVMISKIIPHIRRARVVGPSSGRRQIASGEWIVFRGESFHPAYLRHFLLSDRFHAQFMNTVAGVGGSLVRARPQQVKSIDIPMPSKAEQRRIAAILDHTDALRAKRRQVLAHLDSLTQSIFYDMFGDPARNPQAFPMESLGRLALKFGDGPFGSNLKSEHYRSHGVPVIRLQNIGVEKFLGADRTFISEAHYGTLKKHDCQPGDVLIATMGDPNLRACIQPATIPLALNKADCVQMRVDPNRAVSEWACALLNMPGTLMLATSLILGQTRSRISMGRLRELEVPVPPLSIQKRFAKRVQALNRAQVQQEVSIERTDSLFASLQSRAFRGEL